jgi:hypothetical protein
MKYRVLSSVPDANAQNATVIEEKRKFKITKLSDYIESEADHMKQKLELMGCDQRLVDDLLALLCKTMASADMPSEE